MSKQRWRRSPKLRQGLIDPRQHRCLSELGNNPLCFRQMLKGECALFLDLVQQAEIHLRAANVMSRRVEMKIFQNMCR